MAIAAKVGSQQGTPQSLPVQKTGRIQELDGVRGIAILLIWFDHYIYGAAAQGHDKDTFWGAVIRDIFPLSWSGVDLFFVLSGFLIGGILIDYRSSDGYFKTFYLRRGCRILPLYFIWIGLFFFFGWLLSGHASAGWYGQEFRRLQHFPNWSFFFFLQNFQIARLNDFGPIWTGITWSLCVEEQFYLLMPLVILFTPPRKLPWVLGFLLLAVVVFRFVLHLYSSAFTYVLLPCRADGLLLGVLCAWWVRHPGATAWLQRRKDWLYLAFGVLFAGIVYLTVFARSLDQGMFADLNSFEMNAFGYTWIDAFYACLLMVVLMGRDGPLARFMRIPLLRHFGIISFCIYLTHAAVKNWLQWWILGGQPAAINWMVTLLAFFATWILAVVSWNYFEKPIIGWGHKYLYGDAKN